MKLMICELKARSRYTSREAAYIVKELIEQYGWRQIETAYLHSSSGSLESLLLNKFAQLPQVILFWEGYYLLNARRREIDSLDCDKYIFCDDLHEGGKRTKKDNLEALSMCPTILSTYGYVFHEHYSELAGTHNILWVPHSASPDFMLTYNQHPKNEIFFSGAVNHHYPLRLRMKALCDSGVNPIVFHQHPGYRCDFDYETNTSVGRGYARKINNCRAAFTDSSRYKYAVAKYFEIPATGALLLGDRAISEPLESIGFIDGFNYIGVSDQDLEEKIAYVLDERHHDELDTIRKNGQDLVKQKHTTSDRARLIDEICKDTSSSAYPPANNMQKP